MPLTPTIEVRDEGVSKGFVQVVDFVGAGVTAAVSGNTATVTIAGGAGTPGGADTQVQFNDGGSFGGDSGMTWNKTTNILTVTGAYYAPDGTNAAPSHSFTGAPDHGLYKSAIGVAVAVNGLRIADFAADGLFLISGAANKPSYTDLASQSSGLFFVGSSVLGISVNSIENSRFIAGGFQLSKGSADAVSYAINSRKARGTVASPTVITTGDDLLALSGFGYVGATNTYVEAARIVFDSAGTISDASNGIGGVISLQTRPAGGSLTEVVRIDDSQNVGVGKTATTKLDVNGGGNFDGVVSAKAGSSSDTVKVGGVLSVQTTTTGNVGTGEDNLLTFSVPASTLGTDQDSVWFEAFGSFGNTVNNKNLRVRFGTSGTNLIFETASQLFQNTKWTLQGRIVRTGAATQKAFVSFTSTDGVFPVSCGVVTGLDQTLSGAVTLRITGEATDNNDVVCEELVVGWEPVNT